MTTDTKEAFGIISVLLCLVQYGPLVWLTFKGRTTPHVITRVVWAFTFSISCAAQYIDHGGAGSWVNGVSALFCIMIAIAALGRDKSYITRSDQVALAGILMAIPIWLLTRKPLYAALWATGIDMMAYYPTFRKAWIRPHDELISSFLIGILKQLLALFAMEHFSLTTMIFPVSTVVGDMAVVSILVMRRFSKS